jgi:hypothetical protein
LSDGQYPLSLIHIDPARSNIRYSPYGVRFIDFENAVVAAAPLGCELILARLEHASPGWPAGLSTHLRSAYVRRWTSLGTTLRPWQPGTDLRLLAQIMVAAVHWRVLCERIETGEWSGPLDVVWARGIQRLAKSLENPPIPTDRHPLRAMPTAIS